MQPSFLSLRLLLWFYFWLLLSEGALRKWFFPSLSTPLLIVRDPVLLLMYAVAMAQGVFPVNRFIIGTVLLAGLTFAASLVASDHFGITLFGLRTDFLHVPLIFLLPKVFRPEDVRRIGRWLLVLSIPMSLLVVWQFLSPAGARINAAAGGEGAQLLSTGSRIRPAGTFSFVSGMISYLSVVSAFLLSGFLDRGTLPRSLLAIATPCIIVCVMLSGSRAALGCVTIIAGTAVVVCLRRFSRFKRVIPPAILAYLVYLGLCSLPLFHEGVENQAERFRAGGGVQHGIVARYLGIFGESLETASRTPLLGHGLGMGTNVAAALLTGSRSFLLAESEWSRVIAESGPVLGYAYLLLRLAICAFVARQAWAALKQGQALPWLLVGAAGLDLVAGQFGQPTTLGFAVFTAGLAQASIRPTRPQAVLRPPPTEPRRIRGRSALAEAILKDRVANRRLVTNNLPTEPLLPPPT